MEESNWEKVVDKMEDSGEELLKAFGADYKEAPIPDVNPDSEWEAWARTIEFKISRQGQLIIGVAVGTLAALGLGLLNGRLVIQLVKGHGQLVEAINPILSRANSDGAEVTTHSGPSYAVPTKTVDTSKAAPIDEELAAELQVKLSDPSNQAEIPPELQL